MTLYASKKALRAAIWREDVLPYLKQPVLWRRRHKRKSPLGTTFKATVVAVLKDSRS